MGLMRVPRPDERAQRIRECFRKWDVDGKGYITKSDLKAVLRMLLPEGDSLSADELDQLMTEADRNGNGRIEYHEFVDWLTRPGSTVHAGAEDVELFDLEDLLRPLFQIYDRNGDGSVSAEEFAECHNILQTALTLHPTDGKKGPRDPEMVVANPSEVFDQVDRNNDTRICFDEFVKWQRSILEESGLLNDDLVDLLPALTRQLKRVFKLAEKNEEGELITSDENVLLHITKNVAMFTRDLYNSEAAGHSSLRGRHHYTNRWSEPPVGLNVDRLKGLHMSIAAVPTWGVADTDLVVLCIPEPDMRDKLHRRWFARVIRKVTYRTGRVETDEPHFYVYDNLLWSHSQSFAKVFRTSHEALPPELRIFCHIKTFANFGLQMPWQQVQGALRECVAAELLTSTQVELYNAHIEGAIIKALRENAVCETNHTEIARFRDKTLQAPRSIMAAFVELGILRASSVWADALES